MSLRRFEIKTMAEMLYEEVKEYNIKVVGNIKLDINDALKQLEAANEWRLKLVALRRINSYNKTLHKKGLSFGSTFKYTPIQDVELEQYTRDEATKVAQYIRHQKIVGKKLNYTLAQIIQLVTVTPIDNPASGMRIMRKLLKLTK